MTSESRLLKYRQAFKQQVLQQISDLSISDTVKIEDIYQFLHKIKGTGSTVGLPIWSLQAELLLDDLESVKDKHWLSEEAVAYLKPIYQLCEDMEVETNSDNEEDETVPQFVLLVTDNVTHVDYIKGSLESGLGCSVLLVDSVKRATSSFFKYSPVLVIIDQKLSETNDGSFQYFKNKLEETGIPIACITTAQADSDYESWDIVINSSVKNTLWLNQSKRILNKASIVKRSFASMKELNDQWELYLQWLKQEVVLAQVDISNLRGLNEDKGFAEGDYLLHKLGLLLKEFFPAAALFRGKEDDYILIFKSTSPSSVRDKITKKLAGALEHSVTVTTIKVENGVSSRTALRKLRDRHIFNDSSNDALKSSDALYLGIIDDDDLVRNMLYEQFKDMDKVDVATFREGESFFEDSWHRQEGRYLLVIDGMMPRMDGYEVVHRLRKQYDLEKYSILMLTGRKSENDIVRAMELGVDDYVTKPFGIKELDARIKRLFKRLEG